MESYTYSPAISTLFADLICGLVDRPERVILRVLRGEALTMFELAVEKEDYSKVIGRKGRTATALRELAHCISGAQQHKYRLEFPQPEALARVGGLWRGETTQYIAKGTPELFSRLVEALVDHPEAVQLRVVEGEQTAVLELAVSPEDIPRIIGRKGATAIAMRELLTSLGGKDGRRYHLEILEPDAQGRKRGGRQA